VLLVISKCASQNWVELDHYFIWYVMPGPHNPHAHGFGQTGRWQTQPMGSLKKKLYYLNGVVLSGTTFNRGFSLAPAFKTV